MDPKFRIYFEGLPDDAIRSAEKVVTSLNKANDAQKRYSRERQQLARTERQERFRELSQEEQYQRLLQRREQIERRLAQARARGQGSRVDALELLAARNRSSLRGYGPSVPPIIRGATVGGGGLMGALYSAAQNGGLGMTAASLVGGVALGTLIGRIGAALASAVRGALRFSDEISDLAEQSGLTNREVLKIRQAAGAAGVSTTRALSALSALSSARSNALGGDQATLAAFTRLGIDSKTLSGTGTPLDLARMVYANSKGSRSSSVRADIGHLFGRNPEQVMAVLGGIGADSSALANLEKSTEQLARFQSHLEAAGNALTNFVVRIVAALSGWDPSPEAKGKLAGLYAFGKEFGLTRPKLPFGLEGMWQESASAAGLNQSESAALEVTKKRAESAQIVEAIKVQKLGAKSKKGGKISMADMMVLGVNAMPPSDDLSRMGFYRGARDNEGVGLLRKQIKLLSDIYKAQQEANAKLEDKL